MAKILLVDDDRLVLETLTRGLQRMAYTVFPAHNGDQALRICERETVDLALLDIRMPDMDGIELATALGERKVPVVFLSAYDDEDIVTMASGVGAMGYLVKPLEIQRIVPALEIALMRAQDLNKAEWAIENLNQALNNNRDVDVAIGILMERYRLNRVLAFEKLRSHARAKREKIADVAKLLIDGGSLD